MSYGGVLGRVGDALEPYDDSRSGTARETRDGPGPGHGGSAAGQTAERSRISSAVSSSSTEARRSGSCVRSRALAMGAVTDG
jgi:hypothetical protein